MNLSDIHQLFIHSLKDLYSAENQLINALPKMAEASSNPDLKKGFEEHLEQTKEHAKRLEQIAKDLEFGISGVSCKAMKGLIDEGSELIEMEGIPEVKDAALIGAAQKVEHYEISGYGTAIALADLMSHTQASELLNKTLEEESQTDEKLTDLADSKVNQDAMDAAPMKEE